VDGHAPKPGATRGELRVEHLVDLEPTEESMEANSLVTVLVPAALIDCVSEGPEEEKQIARSHVLACQVSLSRPGLTECRAPPVGSWKCCGAEIGVEVRWVRRAHSTIAELFDYLAERRATYVYVSVAQVTRLRVRLGYRQRYERSVFVHGTRNATSNGVEAFATENDLH
jgi:hypothetical protein